MAFYDEMQALATEILSDVDFKQGTIRYLKMVPGNGPADNPGSSTVEATEVQGVARGVSFKFVKDGLALSTDLTVTIAVPTGIDKDPRDFIEIDGTRYKIVSDISAPVAGTKVVWKFIVRKS